METTVKQRLIIFLAYKKIGQKTFALSCNLSGGFVNSIRSSIQPKTMHAIAMQYPDLNSGWLLTGEGEMLKEKLTDNLLISEPKLNYEKKGVPYYDVDFIGGYDMVINDKTTTPSYYIDFQQYNKADHWVNITGHSMEPLISHGDMIAIRELQDWNTYLLSGEIYVVVTDEYRTVKKVRKSGKGDDYIRLVPLNLEFDEQDIPKSIIRKVFQVLGTAKKIF